MKNDIKNIYNVIEKEIELVYDYLKLFPKDKESKKVVKNATLALRNIEISARCAFLTNHPETLLYIDCELDRILTHIMKYIEIVLGTSGIELKEKMEKSRKDKN